MKTHNIATTLFTTTAVNFVLSFIVFKVFSFEVGVIFAVCLATGFIMAGFVGVENTIIIAKNRDREK